MEGLAKIQAKPYAKNDRLRVFFCVNESLFRCDLHQSLLNSDRNQNINMYLLFRGVARGGEGRALPSLRPPIQKAVYTTEVCNGGVACSHAL